MSKAVANGLMFGGFIWLAGDSCMALARADRHLEYAIADAAFGLGLVIVGAIRGAK